GGGRPRQPLRRATDRADRWSRAFPVLVLSRGSAIRRSGMTTKLEPRGRKVKILATVGPASRDPDMLRRLFRAGADAFRVNLSHGDHATHAETIRAIRALENEFNRPIAVLCDLQG